MKRRTASLLTLLAAVGILIGACAPTAPASSAAPTSAATAAASKAPVASMRVAILADEGTLTPFSYKFGYPGQQMMYLTYDTLMVLDADNIPKPLLAKEVKTSADGATYDVTLRSGVKWHDGRPLTNEDVKFSFDFILAGTRAAFRTPIRTVTSVTLTGTEGLTIKLSAPNPSFPVRALAAVPIIPKHIWEGVDPAKQGEFKATVGSGPYKLIEATPDTVYRMQANTEYFLGAPPVTELIWPVIKDQNTAFQALRTGEIQALIREVPPEQISQFSAAPFKIAKGAGFASTMLQFNDTRAPWNKKEVRQAVDYAIDKKKLVEALAARDRDELRSEHGQHARPHHQEGGRHGDERERRERQDEVPCDVEPVGPSREAAVQIARPERGEHPQADTEDGDEDHGQPEPGQ